MSTNGMKTREVSNSSAHSPLWFMSCRRLKEQTNWNNNPTGARKSKIVCNSLFLSMSACRLNSPSRTTTMSIRERVANISCAIMKFRLFIRPSKIVCNVMDSLYCIGCYLKLICFNCCTNIFLLCR